MSRPNNNFSDATNRLLSHSQAMASFRPSFTSPSRLIFDWQTNFDVASHQTNPNEQSEFQKEVQKNYEQKLKSLSTKIRQLEAQNLDQNQIKSELKKEKAKLLQEAFNLALKNLKINKAPHTPVTYLEVVNDPDYGKRIEGIYQQFEAKANADLDKAVDEYYKQNAIASGKATDALLAIPPAASALDLTSPNPEIQQLQALRAKRENVLDNHKSDRQKLLQNEALRWRATTAKIDEYTNPNGGMIDDFDDGFNPFDKIEDENSPTRQRLNGYLYANYIFAGGGESGMNAVNASIKRPYELYQSFWGNRLTKENLESDLGMQAYFKEAKQYSNFDRPIGIMAGLLKLIDENIKDPTEHQRYTEYVRGKFAELKTGPAANNEEKQLEHLFGIQSRAEFLHLDPNWRNALDSIDQLTDPTRDGAKITDYPGTFSSNKDNPTRHQLNGYLYSVYLYSGKNHPAIQTQFDRAAKIYEDSHWYDSDFTQAQLENEAKEGQDGFGLGVYLKEAANFSKYDTVKGTIAGLLKQSDSIAKNEERTNYQEYLRKQFDLLAQSESEESQLMKLSTIRSPQEFNLEHREELRIAGLDLMLKATQQHNQFKFTPELITKFSINKMKPEAKFYENASSEALQEMQTFVKLRSEAAMNDLREKYGVLAENNSRLKTPKFTPNELNPLRLAVENSNKEFNQALAISSLTDLRAAVEDKYLEKLARAERNYFPRVKELEAKLQTVNNIVNKPVFAANAATPSLSRTAPSEVSPSLTKIASVDTSSLSSSPATSPSSEKNEKEASVDPYTANWANAERVEPLLEKYSGSLTVDSTDTQEKVIGYNHKGGRRAVLNNNSEVFRTPEDAKLLARQVGNLNFVRVTYGGEKVLENGRETIKGGKKVWIPEEQLFRKEAEA